MKLSVGIVGLPNVGKSTLFNALTKNAVPAENYPFCTIDPSVGIVAVPDNRLDTLTKISHSQKTIPAVIEFVDIAGLVKGASEGEGLGNQFLAHIREVDMIAEVVRIFDDQDIIHVHENIDPMFDVEIINLELKTAGIEKPILYVLNKKAGAFNFDEQNDERWTVLKNFFEETNSEYVLVDAGVENELKDLSEDEKQEFRREYGTQDSGIADLIVACYRLLGLISYFTTGEDETRAWTITNGATAPEAGTAIHTDFKTKFIRASVVSYADLVACGSFGAARDRGLLRTEGKEYLVKNGDVIEFRI